MLKAKGTEGWNKWRKQNQQTFDLSGIDLSELDIRGINLNNTKLKKARFRNTYMWGANFTNSNMEHAELDGARLPYAHLINVNLDNSRIVMADLTCVTADGASFVNANLSYSNLTGISLKNKAKLVNTKITGVSVWDINKDDSTIQKNLIITGVVEPLLEFVSVEKGTMDNIVARTNNIETAHLLTLVANGEKLKEIIDTLTKNVVLLLGNFSPRRKAILQRMGDRLTQFGYTPVIFDFPVPDDRGLIDSVTFLASMSSFVIADLTKPRSVPLEALLVASELMVPFAGVIQANERPFAMFHSLQQKYHWLLPITEYKNDKDLLNRLKTITMQCEEMKRNLRQKNGK